MAHYRITGEHIDDIDRARRDYASTAFYRAVYETVKANAGLDTQWGWRAARKAGVICADIERGVPAGWVDSVNVLDERITIRRLA